MKKTIIYLSFTLITSSIAFGQTAPAKSLTQKQRAETTIQQLQGQLLLSDKQKTDLYNVFFFQYKKIDSLKNINADPSGIRAQLKYDYAQITALLSPSQLEKYNSLLAEKRNHTKH